MPTKRTKSAVLRRPSYLQGRGLEITGHAIEYLIDSYVTRISGPGGRDDQEAAQILMRLNLSIYEECPEVIPFTKKVRSHMHNAFLPVVSVFSAFTASWIGVLLHLHRKVKAPIAQEPLSESARVQRLIEERYGKSHCRRDEKTGLYWIITESGQILDSGDSEEEAWTHSAFHTYESLESESIDCTEDKAEAALI